MWGRRLGPVIVGIAATGTLLAGCGNGASPTASPTRSTSATSTTSSTPTPEPTSETPTSTPPRTFAGTAEDFKIEVKVLKKECFGSAGCNLTYRIKPKYVGYADLPEEGVVEVTYEVHGFEDGEAINTFTIEGKTATFPSKEHGSTASSDDELTAEATDVNYDPEG